MLQSLFERAGVPFERAARPLRDADRGVFQMDIPREPAERLRLWPGSEGNRIEVLSIEPPLRQLVLLVQEPPRTYEDRLRRETAEAAAFPEGVRLIRPRGGSWIVERRSGPAERRFLVGYDQEHLFAAQVPSGDSVAEAREALQPDEVRRAGSAVRQGEWFFVPATRDEEAELRGRIATERRALRPGALGGRRERAHWAEFLVALPGTPERCFVRGSVHHPDHRTVCFDRWRRVHANREVRRRLLLARGFYWRD
jgi:hypothetical protein